MLCRVQSCVHRRIHQIHKAWTTSIPSSFACPNVLDKSTGIDVCATLQYDIVPSNLPGSDNGLLCRCLEAESDEWISLAFSKTGGMVGNKAIIYVPGDDTVPKYDIF